MTLHLIRQEPCYHLVLDTGLCPSWHDDGCPHHLTLDEAVQELSDWLDDPDEHPDIDRLCIVEFGEQCVRIECDAEDHLGRRCAAVFDGDGQWGTLHIARSDAGDWICSYDAWSAMAGGRHRCPDHPAIDDDEDDAAPSPGPDAVPLPFGGDA